MILISYLAPGVTSTPKVRVSYMIRSVILFHFHRLDVVVGARGMQINTEVVTAEVVAVLVLAVEALW